MNPVLYQSCQVVASRIKLSPEGVVGPRFKLEIRFSEQGQPLLVDHVHLTDEAQTLIASGDVTGLSVETLQTNSLASSLLGSARQVVTGLELADKTQVCTLPKALVSARRAGLAVSTLVCMGAVGWMLATSQALAPALLLVVATHALRSFWAIPASAFPGLQVHDALKG